MIIKAIHPRQMQKHSIPNRSFFDRFGIFLSLLCAIHCLATPLFLLLFPFLSTGHGVGFHFLMIGLVVPVAGMTFWKSYRLHGKKGPMIFGLIGIVFLLLGVSMLEIFHHAATGVILDRVLTSVGSLSLIVGHWKNLKQCSCEHH